MKLSKCIRCIPAAIATAIVAPSFAIAQTNFPEVEPNSSKPDANVVSCMTAGDTITGTSTGGLTGTGLSTIDTTDYFKITRCAQPLGVYRNTLTVTTSTPGHTGSLRGLSQTGTIGVGGTPVAGSDIALQTLTGTQQFWYGFGKSETIMTRVTGTVATTSSYTDTLSTASVTPTFIGNFAAGSITITTEGQGHTSDTDFWVYDGSFNAIPTFGNDDTFPANGGFEGTLTRTYPAGTYYIAMATYNLFNNLGAANDDNFVTGNVLDFPNAVGEISGATLGNLAFAVTDSAGTTPVAATKTVWWEILWYQFTVSTPTPGTTFCIPNAGGVIACACGNPNGAGVGCANTGSSGASISSAGSASLASDATDPGSMTLTGTSMLSGSSCIFLQGDALAAAGAGVTFGAGIRCTGGQLFRLYTKTGLNVAGGTMTAPTGADRSISNRSSDLGTPIPPSTTRYYQIYYRDPGQANPGGSCPANDTFNITTGQQVAWGA